MKLLQRLMANDIAYGLVLLAFVAAVVAWIYWPHNRRPIVQTRTTVLVEPSTTPLPRDSGPANNTRPTSSRANPVRPSGAAIEPNTATTPRSRSQGTAKTQKPKAAHKPSSGAQGGSTAPQPSSPQSSPSRPLVGVTVPAPVTVCLRPAATVNC
jgi:hypothetical protein